MLDPNEVQVPVMGFVGAGFVGGAAIRAFSGYNHCIVYDKGMGIGSMEEVCDVAEVIFVAVPTPPMKNGECDTSIVEEVVYAIDQAVYDAGRNIDGVEVVIRSTVPPAFLTKLWENTTNISVLFMPEFLTERTADLDFITAPRYIIGTQDVNEPDQFQLTWEVLNNRFPRTRITVMKLEEAALVKYATNVFFAMKISYFNELYKVAEAVGADPTKVIEEVIQDGRIGRSHFQVPGHDGNFGFGGHCFPKDVRAFSNFAYPNTVMSSATEFVNHTVRKEEEE
jgi:UDPglucose 6-dehydrogenase